MIVLKDSRPEMILTPPISSDVLSVIYTRYNGLVLDHVNRLAGNSYSLRDQVPDLAHDTFLRADRALRNIGARSIDQQQTIIVRPWILRIGTNIFYDAARRNNFIHWDSVERNAQIVDQMYVAPDNPAREVVRNEERHLVRDIIDTLQPRHRVVLELLLRGLDHEEIGIKLGLNRQAAKSLVRRAERGFRSAYLAGQNTPEFDF